MKKSAADLVCFGSADRMRDPAVKKLFPEAKTVICVAFRQLRGTRRGIEEGTVYYQYTTSVETVEEVMIPGALLRGCAVLEEAGFDALPQRRFQLVMQQADGKRKIFWISKNARWTAVSGKSDFPVRS